MFISAILLAAGSATRMGAEKLQLLYKGRRLIDRALAALTDCPRIDEVIFVVRPDQQLGVDHPKCRIVVNPDYREGMGSSLRTGVAAANAAADALVVSLADMPELTPEIVASLIDAFVSSGKSVLVPVCDGRHGHPVVFAGRWRSELSQLSGDLGARAIINDHPDMVAHFETDDRAVIRDVDTPADLEPKRKVLIKGAGEQASGTAHRLFRCGFHVVMTDLPWPKALRLGVSFCSAIFDREIVVEGVRGVGYTLDEAGMLASFDWSHIPVFVDPECRLKALWKPDVIIDGRILKANLDNHVGDAPLVIGYGPGLVAGQDVDFVVETNRGHNLGRIIANGCADPDTGVPGSIEGFTYQRLLRSPTDGTLVARHRIGDVVQAGDVIATVADQPITAAIPGVLRGLVYPGSPVVADQKVGDIDPRGDPAYCRMLSDKTRTISGAALEIILSHLDQRRLT
ncbi:MAG TPA: selenium-dependent molybdenum cofactor biosynthesis protein YqeB [Phycisphaerae bacterium]|nr:selenium-dependent molybdenum cofactor biosynthesis protein YqeB [Phycisphaerae bacterium]